jgi:hypothetical protein
MPPVVGRRPRGGQGGSAAGARAAQDQRAVAPRAPGPWGLGGDGGVPSGGSVAGLGRRPQACAPRLRRVRSGCRGRWRLGRVGEDPGRGLGPPTQVAAAPLGPCPSETAVFPECLRIDLQRAQARQSVAWRTHGVLGHVSPWKPIRVMVEGWIWAAISANRAFQLGLEPLFGSNSSSREM